MARRRNRPRTVAEEEDWLTTFADAITLLMAFFVMLVSFSKIELPLFEAVQAGIKEEIGGQVASERPIYALHNKVQAIVDTTQSLPPGDVQVGFDDEGIVIDFLVGSFFGEDSVELSPEAALILEQIRLELELPPYDLYQIDVEGHSDDTRPDPARFASNWELTARQAARVVREMIALGIEPERLKAAGFADTRPKKPFKDMMGEAIEENRALNRRISIRLHP